MLTSSNVKAFAILAIFMDKIKNGKVTHDTSGRKFMEGCVLMEAYVNGREQGFSIHYGSYKVSFSENRNSDNIVVYAGLSYKFSMQGNVPDETIYRDSKFFNENDYEKAAIYCLEQLQLKEKE